METGCVELGLRDDSSNPGQGIDVAEGSVTIATAGGEPPEYDMLCTGPAGSPGHNSDLPPLDYDTVMRLPEGSAVPINLDEVDRSKGSLIAEAPPSYREIYGNKKPEPLPPQTRRWRRTQRPHTLSRRQRSQGSNTSNPNTLSRLLSFLPGGGSRILVVSIALLIFLLPFSMVTVGSLNLNTCYTKDIPLYLIIAGTCLCIEVIIHTVTILASMSTEKESVLRSLRMCDCFAFFILVWILIGSNWIFKVTVNSRPCLGQDSPRREPFGDLGNSTNLIPDITTPTTCEDCSNTVYQFAVGLIILQYIVVLFVFVVCCCFGLRKGAQ